MKIQLEKIKVENKQLKNGIFSATTSKEDLQ